MSFPVTWFAAFKVTRFAFIFFGVFLDVFCVNLCHILKQEKRLKVFPKKSEKICSQILRYFFCIYTIMVTNDFFWRFSKVQKGIEKWTFINVQNGKTKIPFN
jgi:uncharacterized membrane protein YidH (DUF202 family)